MTELLTLLQTASQLYTQLPPAAWMETGNVLRNIQYSLNLLTQRNITINIFWTIGHINLPGNDAADTLAKEAACEVSILPDSHTSEPLALSEAKNLIKKVNINRWQKKMGQKKHGGD
jgi:hypothetical protein